MKSTPFLSFQLDPELRHDAESVPCDSETLSSFSEESLRQRIIRRKLQREFIGRGLCARDKARFTGQYASKDDVMDSLYSILSKARRES